MSETDWIVSETVQIGKCQKLLRLENVRNSSNWKVSELEMVRFRGPRGISVFQILLNLPILDSQSSPFIILTLDEF